MEAEALAARHRLSQFAEYWRGKYAIALLAPVVLITLAFFAFNGPLARILLARQCLLPVEIPRSVTLEPETPELWPSGDEVIVRFRATGQYDSDATGSIRVRPEGQPTEDYPLRFSSHDGDRGAIYTATVPPSSQPFSFRGWLQDGRSRSSGQVRFEARPVVDRITAHVILPEYVGKTPEGKRYARFMPQAEVMALTDSQVRVSATANKPIVSATVVVFGRDDAGKEVETSRVPMELSGESAAEATFSLPAKPTAYRIEATDRNGFANANPPRRGITVLRAGDDVAARQVAGLHVGPEVEVSGRIGGPRHAAIGREDTLSVGIGARAGANPGITTSGGGG